MSGNASIPQRLDEAVRGELRAGEQVRWLGMPKGSHLARKSLPIALFGLFFGGFAAFWITMAAGGLWFGKGMGKSEDAAATPAFAAESVEGSEASAPAPAPAAPASATTEKGSNGTKASSGAPGFQVVSLCFPLFGLPFLAIGLGMISTPFWVARGASRTLCVVTNQRAMEIKLKRAGSTVRSWDPQDLGPITRETFADGRGTVTFAMEEVSAGRSGGTRMSGVGFVGVLDPRGCEDALRALSALPARPTGAVGRGTVDS